LLFSIFVTVFKKYTILSLLFLAYTIVLAHSVVPHHHHDEDYEMEQTSHHHDDDHDDDSGLASDFANFIHSGTTGDFHQQPELNISCNAIATAYVIAIFDFQIKPIETPPSIDWPDGDNIPIDQQCLFSKGLRAPPSTLA
jgi:hypothetical protein